MPGELPAGTIAEVLKALPLDITFIDENDVIRYFSDYRIFRRTPDILGTAVHDCHSSKSRDAVNKVIDDLRSGRESVSEHPTTKGGRAVRVRYIAVRDACGKYIGLVETAEWVD
jgi:uncharacterized protein